MRRAPHAEYVAAKLLWADSFDHACATVISTIDESGTISEREVTMTEDPDNPRGALVHWHFHYDDSRLQLQAGAAPGVVWRAGTLPRENDGAVTITRYTAVAPPDATENRARGKRVLLTEEVISELERIDEKVGHPAARSERSAMYWLGYMGSLISNGVDAFLDSTEEQFVARDARREDLIELAAIALQWVDALDRERSEKETPL